VFTSDMKVGTRRKESFFYPDVTVVCGPPEYHDKVRDVLTNATVIFEVLSPSTECFDSTHKRQMYQSIPSFREYLLVEQDEPLVEHWQKQTDTIWTVRFATGLDAEVHIESIGCTLKLAEIYERLTFPEPV
jgi:Uma2 family endonuclease